jgi:hypothetical protein
MYRENSPPQPVSDKVTYQTVLHALETGELSLGRGTLLGVSTAAHDVMGYVCDRLREAGWPSKHVSAVRVEMMLGGDYNHLLNVGMAVLTMEDPDDGDEWDEDDDEWGW